MLKLKGAIIGVGKMGMLHYSIANSHPNVEIVAICDKSEFSLKMFNKLTGVQTFTDHRKLIKKCKLDFAVIATPVKFHFQIISDLIDNDISIFTEKPLTKTFNESEKLLQKLKNKKNLKNQVGYMNRYHAIFSKVRELIEQNYLGNIINFTVEMYGGVTLRELESWCSNKDISGGGCLIEFASHNVDLINFYFGKPKKIVGASIQSIYSKNIEDYVHAMFEFDSGIIGWLNSNWSDETYRLPSNIITINGSNGKIIAKEHKLVVYLNKGNDIYQSGWNIFYITDFAKPVRIHIGMPKFTNQLDDFINSILNDVPNKNSFESALTTDWIIEKIYSKTI